MLTDFPLAYEHEFVCECVVCARVRVRVHGEVGVGMHQSMKTRRVNQLMVHVCT